MKLLFKQRLFSWLDSYDVYNNEGMVIFQVEGKLSWGHCLEIHDATGHHVGTVKEEVLRFLPQFQLIVNDRYIGKIRKELTFFHPKFMLDFNGWTVDGDLFEWDYEIRDGGMCIAAVTKRLWNFTDTYEIDVANPGNVLYALMVVLAIDAAKCSSQGN